MPVSSSRLSYSDCFTLFEKALEDTKGARFQVNGGDLYGDAYHFRLRMHQARAIDRKDNREIYTDPGHRLHGRSELDSLVIQIKGPDTEGKWWIYVKHTEINVNDIEVLSEVEADYPMIEYERPKELVVPEPVLQITDQSIRRRV